MRLASSVAVAWLASAVPAGPAGGPPVTLAPGPSRTTDSLRGIVAPGVPATKAQVQPAGPVPAARGLLSADADLLMDPAARPEAANR